MLPIAALIVADQSSLTFGGLSLNERAALMADAAGIHTLYFMGARLPDVTAMRRVRNGGAVAISLGGWPRVFAAVPNAELLVVIDARTIIEPAVLTEILDEAKSRPGRALLLVDEGDTRKDSLICVADGSVTSVLGDGNAMNCGVLAIPYHLMARVRTVWSLRDAVHRLAKANQLAAVAVGDRFCRVLDGGDAALVEREYAQWLRKSAWRSARERLATLYASLTPWAVWRRGAAVRLCADESAKPDMLVAYHASFDRKFATYRRWLRLRAVLRRRMSGGGPCATGRGRQLVIDITDRATGSIVWRGVAKAT